MKTMKLRIEVLEGEKTISFTVLEIVPHATFKKYSHCCSEDYADITDSTFYLWNGTSEQNNSHTHKFTSINSLKNTLIAMLKDLLVFDKAFATKKDTEKISTLAYNGGKTIEFDSEKQKEIILFFEKEREMFK